MHDTHCHIDLYDNPESILLEVERSKVLTIAVTNLPSAYFDALPHVRHFSHVHLGLGLHPLLANHHTSSQKRLFKDAFPKTHCIGEVGLDFSGEGLITKAIQIESFRFVLDLVSREQKVMTIHSRRAESTVLALLDEFNIGPAIFHWYSGSPSLISKVSSRGHYFSINPSMIGRASGQAIIARIPPGQVLTETDGPFVKIEKQPARPIHVQRVHEYLSSVWGVSTENVDNQLELNLRNLFQTVQIAIT